MIELILWLCFFVPGLIYSFWRLSSRYDACACCGSTALVPAGSPVGRTLAQQYHAPAPAGSSQPSAVAAGVASGPSAARGFGLVLGRTFRKFVLRK